MNRPLSLILFIASLLIFGYIWLWIAAGFLSLNIVEKTFDNFLSEDLGRFVFVMGIYLYIMLVFVSAGLSMYLLGVKPPDD